jgi:O-antigen/teichoic acid export membrane protein
MTPVKKILRNAGLLFSSQIVVGIATLIQGVIVARSLGASDYGVMGVAIAYALMVYRIFDCRVWEAITKFIPQFTGRDEHEAADAVLRFCLWIELATGLIAAAIVWFSADWAERTIFHGAASASWIRLASFLVVLRIPFEIAKALLRLADRFGQLAKQIAFISVVQLLLVAAICLSGATIQRLLVVHLVTTAINCVIFSAAAYKASHQLQLHILRTPRWSALQGHWRDFLSFLVMTNLNATSRFANKIDLIVVGWFGTMSDVGIYQVAMKATQLLAMPAAALRQAIFPEMSKLAAGGNPDQLRRLPWQLTRLIALGFFPICLLATVAAPWCVPWALGAEYAAATLLVQILVWNGLGRSLVWFHPYLLSTGRTRAALIFQFVVTVLNTAMLAFMTQAWGVVGAAISRTARVPIQAALVWVTLSPPSPFGRKSQPREQTPAVPAPRGLIK